MSKVKKKKAKSAPKISEAGYKRRITMSYGMLLQLREHHSVINSDDDLPRSVKDRLTETLADMFRTYGRLVYLAKKDYPDIQLNAVAEKQYEVSIKAVGPQSSIQAT